MQTKLSATAVPARDASLKGLTCAYTGKPLDVRLTVAPQTGVHYYAVGSDIGPYDTRSYDSAKALLEALSERDGIPGSCTGDAILLCPYTGAKLRVESKQGRFHAVGGWNPYKPQPGPQQFAYYAKMRGGKPAEDTSKKAPKITVTPEESQELKADPLREPFAEQAEKMTEEFQGGVAGKVTIAGGVALDTPVTPAPKVQAPAPAKAAPKVTVPKKK